MVIKHHPLKDPSLSSFAKTLILPCAVSLAFLLNRNSSDTAFIIWSGADAVISHDVSNGYRCCIARYRYEFPALNVTSLTLPSLPGYTSFMNLSFQDALFCSLFFMTTTPPPPPLTTGSHLLYFKLCLLQNDVRYSFLHFFHTAALHLCLCFCLFGKSLFSVFVKYSVGTMGVWPETGQFSIKTGNGRSSAM